MTTVLGLIPARGGSSRVPDKNLRTVGSKPLIGHAVDAAIDAEVINKVVVSTDDDRISARARDFGVDATIDRPADLASDTAPVQDVVSHCLSVLENRGEKFDIIAMLLPTVPFRTSDDINAAITKLRDSNANAVVSVSPYLTPPHWAVTEDTNGYLSEYFEGGTLWTDSDIPRSQDLPEMKHPNGAIFAAYVDNWKTQETFYQPETVGYSMPIKRSIDIDTVVDLQLARGLAAMNGVIEPDLRTSSGDFED